MGAGGLLVGAIGPVSIWRTRTGRGWTWKGRLSELGVVSLFAGIFSPTPDCSMPECLFQLGQFGLFVLQGSFAAGFGCVDEIVRFGTAESTHLHASTESSLVPLRLQFGSKQRLSIEFRFERNCLVVLDPILMSHSLLKARHLAAVCEGKQS